MTAIDWIIIGFTFLMALWGYMQGLVVSALSLGGFAAGAIAGSRLAPLLLDQGSRSPYAPLLALTGALFVGGIVAAVLEQVGSQLRRRITFAPLAVTDGVLGAALLGALGLGLAWVGGAVALQTPGATDLRESIQRSAILRRLNDVLPPSGPILNALSRVDPFPTVPGPDADVPAPTRGILADRDVRRAHDSVVRVTGSACGLAVEGSGWVSRSRGLVVTNAHVVAGQDDTGVALDGGARMDAQAVAFDPGNDVAVLQVNGLAAPGLSQSPGDVGDPVAILGFPKNGPYRAEPGRLGPTETVISQDAYGNGPVSRRMTALRGRIRSGNSGGPAVDSRGTVVATVFAASRSRPRGGFGVPPGVVSAVLREARSPVDTGPCVR